MVSVFAIIVNDLAWMSVQLKLNHKLTARLGKLKAGFGFRKYHVNKKAWVIISVAINTATYPVSNITCSLLLIYLLINRIFKIQIKLLIFYISDLKIFLN